MSYRRTADYNYDEDTYEDYTERNSRVYRQSLDFDDVYFENTPNSYRGPRHSYPDRSIFNRVQIHQRLASNFRGARTSNGRPHPYHHEDYRVAENAHGRYSEPRNRNRGRGTSTCRIRSNRSENFRNAEDFRGKHYQRRDDSPSTQSENCREHEAHSAAYRGKSSNFRSSGKSRDQLPLNETQNPNDYTSQNQNNDSNRKQQKESSTLENERETVPILDNIAQKSSTTESEASTTRMNLKRNYENTLDSTLITNQVDNEKSPVKQSRSTDNSLINNEVANKPSQVTSEEGAAVKKELNNDENSASKEDKKIKPKKSAGTKKFTNNSIMQLKLFLLVCKRMFTDNFKIYYISDVKDSQDITDAIFICEKGGQKSILHVKYQLQEFRSYKKINYRTLMNPEFKLEQIYRSFKENQDVDRIIICSNLELDEQTLKTKSIRVLEDKCKGISHLEVNVESVLFKTMIKKFSCIPRLADHLDECIRTQKLVSLKGIIKEYHTMLLAENVIAIVESQGSKQIGKFHSKFIDSPDYELKPAIAHLRRYLKSLNSGELRMGKLILSENFGKSSSYQQSHPGSLADKLAIEETMKKFFEKLEFMECEKNINCHIKRELGEKFDLIQTDFHTEIIKKELFQRLQRGSDQSGLYQALEKKILSCDLHKHLQEKNSTEMKLEFEPHTLKNLESILTESNESIIIIKSDFPALCVFKMQQVVKILDKYNGGQFFFLDVDYLLAAKDHLLAEFRNPIKNLLVVQCEGVNLKCEQLKDCLMCIRQRIYNDPNSTNELVLIQNICDSSFDFSANLTEHKEMFNIEAGLVKASETKLSETICESHGPNGDSYTISLNELILDHSKISELLGSAQIVNKLVKEKVIIGETPVKTATFESVCPIPRRLKRHVIIDSAILKEENQDIFFLFGDENESRMKKVNYFRDFNSALSSFKQFTSQNKKINAHLLKYVSGSGSNQLIWQRSSGSVNSLMKYLVEPSESLHQSEPISDVLACRIMILSGVSGSGKSYYMSELAHRLQASNQNLKHWVVELKLNNSVLEDYGGSPLSSVEEAVNLLTKILGYDELSRRLFHLSAFGKLKLQLSLFVEGLEKLRSKNANRIYKILHLLRKTNVARIYVSTRPEFKKTLEQQLDEFAYNLDSLTSDEQKTFLVNTWMTLANQACKQPNWRNDADLVCNNEELLKIMVEPLYLNIFASIFWNCIKNGQKIPRIHRIYDIYEKYLHNFLHNLEESKKTIFYKSFASLCLQSLLHPDDFRKLNMDVQSNEEFTKLNHSSFAEYGAASWLATLAQRQIASFNIMEDLAERISVVFIETFAVSYKKDYLELIQKIGDNCLVVRLFTHYLWDKADDYQKQQYLQEAVQMNRVKLVSELMLRSTEINLPADFLMQVAIYVVTVLVKDKPKKSHPYWSLSEKLLEQVPQVTAKMDPDAQMPQLLANLFARGNYDAVSKVFEFIGVDEKKKILRARVDGRKPLEIVNSSALMDDEARLAISKFLIKHNDSKANVLSVMTAAAKHGHVQCFKFFAGKSLEMHSDFLKNALKSNQLDVLSFVLNNPHKNHPLHTAVTEEVSIKTLEFLLSYGGVNNRNSNGETALCTAIKNGVDLKKIKYLVEKEADVNAKDNQGLHAWCYAVLRKWCCYKPEQQLEFMLFLKSKKLFPRLPQGEDYQLTCWIEEIKRKFEFLWDPENYDLDDYDRTPRIHTALREKDLDWFEFLLEHGADPDALDSQNRVALHLAVEMERSRDVLTAVRLLLRYGATYNSVDPNGKTPLDLLKSSENATDDKGRAYKLLRQAKDLFSDISFLEQLKKDLSVKDTKAAKSTNLYWLLHCRDDHGRTLAHRAAEKNISPDDFGKLLEFSDKYGRTECTNGRWINSRDKMGETVVHAIARHNQPIILRQLALRGASLIMKNSKGTIPLSNEKNARLLLKTAYQAFAAVERGSLETFRTIDSENRKYLSRARDVDGCTLLHLAALGRSPVTRILLCEWSADPNILDYAGCTPLYYALSIDDHESAKLLLKAGASVGVRNKSENQPVDIERKTYKSVEMETTLNETVGRCWRGKLDITELDATLETLRKKFDLETSVAVNARDSGMNTMVHHAVRNHECELLKALLKHGAEYNARNAAGKTPMDLADGECKELLNSIHKFFGNPKVDNWEDKKDSVDLEIIMRCRKVGGYTLLHTTLEEKKIEEAKWLLDKGADVNVTNCVGAAARQLAERLQLITV